MKEIIIGLLLIGIIILGYLYYTCKNDDMDNFNNVCRDGYELQGNRCYLKPNPAGIKDPHTGQYINYVYDSGNYMIPCGNGLVGDGNTCSPMPAYIYKMKGHTDCPNNYTNQRDKCIAPVYSRNKLGRIKTKSYRI